MAKACYGIDAPPVVAGFSAAIVAGAFGLWAVLYWLRPHLILFLLLGGLCLWVTCISAYTTGQMLYVSLFKKFQVRDRILGTLDWDEVERVLDVGCGRGLLLIGAAKRLRKGKAVGIDLWRTEDQSGNRLAATERNLRAEEVEDRVEVRTADARKMPFPDASFDAVVSSLAIHNIPDEAGRAQAISEVIRVLKPGGRVAIWDIQHAAQYKGIFARAGFKDVLFEELHTFSKASKVPDHLLTARKQEAS